MRKNEKVESVIKRKRVTLAILCVAILVLVVALVIMDKIRNSQKEEVQYDETLYNMEKVVSTNDFDLAGANELNAGLVELKSVGIKEVQSVLLDQTLEYRYSDLLLYDRRVDYYKNGIVATYNGNELDSITGYRENVLELLKNKSLSEYLEDAAFRDYFTTTDGDQLIYGYESSDGSIKYKELMTDGPNENKSYIFVTNYDKTSDKLTLGFKNSNFEVEEVNTKVDLVAMFSKLDAINKELEFNGSKKDIYLIVDNLNNRVVDYGIHVVNEFNVEDYEPDMSKYDSGLYENTADNKELTEEMGFKRNIEGLIVDPLPSGYTWYMPDTEEAEIKIVTSENAYYANWIQHGEKRNAFLVDIEKERYNTMQEDKADKKVLSAELKSNGISVKLFTRNEEEYKEYVGKLVKYGTVETVTEKPEYDESYLIINMELNLLPSK